MSSKDPHAGSAPPSNSKQTEDHVEDIQGPGLDLSSLSSALKARKAEYTRRRTIRVKIGTWNVAAIPGTEKDIGKWFIEGQGVCERFSGVKGEWLEHTETTDEPSSSGTEDDSKKKSFKTRPEEVDLYVLGLQEIVDVSSPAEALRPYTDTGPSNRWKEAVHKALPSGYQLVSEGQLIGLLLLIYASPAILDSVSSISTTSVGTGLMGYMGNKGAVATRLVLGETTKLVFVNSHLAAGSDKGSLERRNWDASQIIARAKFEPVEKGQDTQEDVSERIGDEDFTFWFGDLNYRLDDIPGDDVRQVLSRHTDNAYDNARQENKKKTSSADSQVDPEDHPKQSLSEISVSEEDGWLEPVTDDEIDPHNDPASLQTTISSLIVHDQLRVQQQKGTAFHVGWQEGQITFLPTYKYDIGSVAMFDTSEKQRGPSWCDRILFRTRQNKLKHERLDREAEEARKRDKEMEAQGLDKAVADDNVLFDYDPDMDGADDSGNVEESVSDNDRSDVSSVASHASSGEAVHLAHYVSHQGILSSDHKPLEAIFTLNYDAVHPKLKAKVHQEVARELDKAENESRPGLTVVIDGMTRMPWTSGDVPFDVPIHRSLTIANTSGAPATFSFAEKPSHGDESSSETPSWLEIHIERASEEKEQTSANPGASSSHTLHPGEVANVDVTAHVRKIEDVRLLNLKKVKLEEVLVLHVDSGRDHFISVSGHWLPTCFGCSVDELTRMPEAGARSLSTNGKSPFKQENDVRLSAPRELFRLTEAISDLTERAVAEWDMTRGESEQAPWTRDPGGTAWPFAPDTWTLKEQQARAPLCVAVREALDTNESIGSVFGPEVPPLHRLEILAETLLTFPYLPQ
ncbi:Endonuclease/exonuclease/phosphatase [Penicillium chermesinum]|nr:Endonuclease/exonuclease/phosphatase [Penicillium chermesinum]